MILFPGVSVPRLFGLEPLKGAPLALGRVVLAFGVVALSGALLTWAPSAWAVSVSAKSGLSLTKTVSKEQPYPHEYPTLRQGGITTYALFPAGKNAETAVALSTLRLNRVSLIEKQGQAQNKKGLGRFQAYIGDRAPMVDPAQVKTYGDIQHAFMELGQVFDDMISHDVMPIEPLQGASFPGLSQVKVLYGFVDSESGIGTMNVYVFGQQGDDLVEIVGHTGYQNAQGATECSRRFEFKPAIERDSCYWTVLKNDPQAKAQALSSLETLKTLWTLKP